MRLRTLLVLGFVVGAFAAAAVPVDAADLPTEAPEVRGRFYVVEVDGPIDSIVADELRDVIDTARDPRTETVGIMLRFKKVPGALDTDTVALAEEIRDAPVPVVGFVGPAGSSEVAGGGVLLLAASDLVIAAPETTIGPINPVDLYSGQSFTEAEATAVLERLRPQGDAAGWPALLNQQVTVSDTRVEGVSDFAAPTVGEALVSVDDKAVVLPGGRVVKMDLFDLIQPEGVEQAQQAPKVLVLFSNLGYFEGFLHKMHTPTYAYVMLALGLLAVAFEFYAVSIGIAGVLGGLCMAIGFVAAGALPVNWWAVALLFIGVILLCVDVQQGTLGGFTILGSGALVAASIWFTHGTFKVHWWAMVLVVGGTLLFFAVAMTTVVRTRFATPTIGRDRLLDSTGTVVTALSPDGTVEIEGAVWKARAHRGRIPAGSSVTVRAIQGIVLEVDPDTADDRDGPTDADID